MKIKMYLFKNISFHILALVLKIMGNNIIK